MYSPRKALVLVSLGDDLVSFCVKDYFCYVFFWCRGRFIFGQSKLKFIAARNPKKCSSDLVIEIFEKILGQP